MAKLLEKIEWEALEYEYIKKSPDWFWAIGIITVTLLFSAIFLKNFLFGILILLAGFSAALYGAKKPNIISFSLTPRGIKIGETLYDYENLKRFWINYDPPQKKELLLESKKTLVPQIIIPLASEDPGKIRKYLLKFLKEEKIEESLTVTIANLLRF